MHQLKVGDTVLVDRGNGDTFYGRIKEIVGDTYFHVIREYVCSPREITPAPNVDLDDPAQYQIPPEDDGMVLPEPPD